jgi:PhnB protein
MSAKPIPDEYHSVTPYLVFKDAARAIEFYKNAFGAKEAFRLSEPSGKIGHAEITVGNSRIMLADEYPDFGALSPQTIGGSPVRIHLYVEDSDKIFKQAVKAGGTILRPVADQFYGDRSGMIADPFGYSWNIATHKEDVSPEEMQRRWTAALKA